jgi:hypothetical protein
MKDYVTLPKVTNGNITTTKLSKIDLKERSLNKLDAKIYFLKLKLVEIVKLFDNWENYREQEKDLLKIRYEANISELQVLEYIFNQTIGR